MRTHIIFLQKLDLDAEELDEEKEPSVYSGLKTEPMSRLQRRAPLVRKVGIRVLPFQVLCKKMLFA